MMRKVEILIEWLFTRKTWDESVMFLLDDDYLHDKINEINAEDAPRWVKQIMLDNIIIEMEIDDAWIRDNPRL